MQRSEPKKLRNEAIIIQSLCALQQLNRWIIDPSETLQDKTFTKSMTSRVRVILSISSVSENPIEIFPRITTTT